MAVTVLCGKTAKTIQKQELDEITAKFGKICIDIGTGDGRNIYRKAKNDRETFYIGLDPVKDNMEEIAVKIAKKPEKGGLDNALLVVSTAENLPDELCGIADRVTVLFPWGVLLEGIVKPEEEFINAVKKAAKSGAEFEFITTYSANCEENMMEIRGMPELSLDYFNGEYKEKLRQFGLTVLNTELLDNEFVKGFDSKWARRLAFGRKRDFYRITGIIG
ncbi:MAG: 16S rRNA (adenine(1408)-N(1))-methyltransferase NpmA [Clostridia bacterium]|nr:16S rRNA (adenine(1408)-N(1))-methyltransferase NpmA [Clostridia bacterium]